MYNSHDPKWLKLASRHLSWIAIPGIAILLITLQALGFLLLFSDPIWFERLALMPDWVIKGEYWRLITFLALPLSTSPVWMIFTLLFMYSILNSIESEWGSFKTTLYVLISIILTIAYSLVFNYPVFGITDFVTTLFLATAALFPEQEMRVYFVFPIKMKMMGWLALGFAGLKLFQGNWMDRFFLITIYSNYLIFFGPELLFRIREWKRRREYQNKFR